jgi:hypothetical protein
MDTQPPLKMPLEEVYELPANADELERLLDRVPEDEMLGLLRRYQHWTMIERDRFERFFERFYRWNKDIPGFVVLHNNPYIVTEREILLFMQRSGLSRDEAENQMMYRCKAREPFQMDYAWSGHPLFPEFIVMLELGRQGPDSAYWRETKAERSESHWLYLLWWGSFLNLIPIEWAREARAKCTFVIQRDDPDPGKHRPKFQGVSK